MNNVLKISNLSKSFYKEKDEVHTLDNINLEVKDNEFIIIVGTSGCGKSTLLNIIAGLDKDYSGEIITKDNINIGYMLQSDALLPWLTIEDNCNLGLKLLNKDNKVLVDSYLKKYNLWEFKDKYPNEISGGMRQRCALIRTLVTNPDILLLDEPFSALDYQTRLKIEDNVFNIIKNEGKSVIMVTHDLEEAVSMADKILVLSKRPAKIKKIYEIKLEKNDTPINNRKDKKFSYYLNILWDDLDE